MCMHTILFSIRPKKIYIAIREKLRPGVNFIKVLHLLFTSAAIVFSKGDNSYSCKIQV